jgi:hypothetical protein
MEIPNLNFQVPKKFQFPIIKKDTYMPLGAIEICDLPGAWVWGFGIFHPLAFARNAPKLR